MSKIKSYIMDVETFVDNYFDYDTETFKTNKEKILLDVKNEFGDNMSVEIASDYIDDQDVYNEFFYGECVMSHLVNDMIMEDIADKI